MYRRYGHRLILAGFTLLVFGCTSDQPTEKSPMPSASVTGFATCAPPDSIQALINAAFQPGPDLDKATQQFNDIQVLVGPRQDTLQAQTVAFNLTKFTLQRYRDNQLIGGKGASTQKVVAELFNQVLCFVGLSGNIPPDALGPEGAIAIIEPTSPTTLVIVPQLTSGVLVDSGSVPTTTIVTISRLPDSPPPLLTPLDQYPLFYEYNSSPYVTFNLDVLVGVCYSTPNPVPDPSRLRLAHNVPHIAPTTIEVLPLVPAPFLNCGSSSSGLASITGFAGALATGGVGGTTKNFSPFGTIDTLGTMQATSPLSQAAKVGTAVSKPPQVKLTSATGVPMPGITVTFQVTSGGGSVTGATQVTDQNGIATVGSWTLGTTPGVNTLTATATMVPGTGLTNNPITFTATGDRANDRRR